MTHTPMPDGVNEKAGEAKLFPILRNYSREARPCPTSIPWSVADKAYAVYRARYGTSQSLQRLADRGGFADSELDDLYPGWREEVSEITKLRLALTARDARYERLAAVCRKIRRGDFPDTEQPLWDELQQALGGGS